MTDGDRVHVEGSASPFRFPGRLSHGRRDDDKLGRVRQSTQTTGGVAYNFGDANTDGYSWSLADALIGIKMPSGRTYSWAISGANQQQTVSGSAGTYGSITGTT